MHICSQPPDNMSNFCQPFFNNPAVGNQALGYTYMRQQCPAKLPPFYQHAKHQHPTGSTTLVNTLAATYCYC